MKITFISPGFIEIPPKAHGAVEIIIWDYKYYLEKLGWRVQIANNYDINKTIEEVNHFDPDFVHIHLDHLYYLSNNINCKHVALTNHDGYAEWPELRPPYYDKIVQDGTKYFKGYHFCSSERLRQFYIKYFKVDEDKVFSIPNGANKENFYYSNNPIYTNKSICLGQIYRDNRKNQIFLSTCNASVDFAGATDVGVSFSSPTYIGSWNKEYVYEHLTDYPNLVLLSKGEAAPLVCIEALMAGLGLVITEKAAAGLDTTLPFIKIIPESKMYDINYVKSSIENNREISIHYRNDIREYALDNFDWEKLVKRYHNLLINKLLLL